MDREYRYTEVVAIVRAQAYIRGFIQRRKYKWIKQCIPKRAMIAKEFFDSEASYVNGLSQVVEIYLKPLAEDAKSAHPKLITKDDLRTIFSEIEVILTYSKVMLGRFEERVKNWYPNQKLGDCFFRIIDFLKVYSQYVNNYDKAMDALQRLQKENKAFREFIYEREHKSGVVTPIENFLIMPVQRIPRYSLLLEDLVRHTWKEHPDYESLSKSLTRMNEVAITVNEMKRERENLNKVIQISMSLINIKPEHKQQLLAKNRRCVREGFVTEARLQGVPTRFWLFLFNDLMLWTTAKKGKGYKFKFISELTPDRTAVELTQTSDGKIVRVMVKADPTKDNYHPQQVFKADTDEETIAWFNDMKKLVPAIGAQPESALEESGSESTSTSKVTKPAPAVSSQPAAPAPAPVKKKVVHVKERSYASTFRSTMRLADLKYLEESERARNQKIDAERARIAAWQDFDDMAELSLFQVSKGEVENFFKVFSQSTYEAFGELYEALSELNISWESPEIVLVGRSGDGKTRLLEALLGYPLALVDLKRPMHVHLVNNKNCHTPRITLKKDPPSKINTDVVITSNAQLKKELSKRVFEQPSDLPVHLVFEHEHVFNATIIDTPGLETLQWGTDDLFMTTPGSGTRRDTKNIDISNIVYNIVKNTDRLLVFIEEAKDKNVMCIASRIASAVDPNFVRSVFVYTKFQNKLRDMYSSTEIDSYLASAPKNAQTFFVSLPSTVVRDSFVDSPEKFRKHIVQAYLRDLDHLDRLQYNTQYAGLIGVQKLRRYIHDICRKKYRGTIPTKLDRISAKQKTTEQQLAAIKRKKEFINVNKLRAVANEYIMKFVGLIDKLIEGSTDVEASIYGQDIEDERQCLELIHPDWVDAYNQIIPLKPEKWKVPLWNCKLYGSPQIIRLFNVFSVLVQHYKIKSVKNEDVVAAIGAARPLYNLPFFIHAAFEVAKGKAEKVLFPLVEQLCERAKQMLKRLGVIAQSIITKNSRQAQLLPSSNDSLLRDLDAPLFAGHVRVQYEQLVEELAQECLVQCNEVINQTVIYNFSKYQYDVPNNIDEQEVQQLMSTLAARMFEDMSAQFLRTVTVKCYDILIAKGTPTIKRIIQTAVFSMNDATISELFDVHQLQEHLAHEEKHLLRTQQEIAASRQKFMAASEVFSSEEFKHVMRSLSQVAFSKLGQPKYLKVPTKSTEPTLKEKSRRKLKEDKQEEPKKKKSVENLAVPKKSVDAAQKDDAEKAKQAAELKKQQEAAEKQKKQQEEEAKRKEAEMLEAQRKQAEAEEQRRKAEEQRKKAEEAEAQRKQAEAAEAQRRLAEAEEQRKQAEAAEAQKKQAEAEAQKKQAEAEAQKKQAEAAAAAAEEQRKQAQTQNGAEEKKLQEQKPIEKESAKLEESSQPTGDAKQPAERRKLPNTKSVGPSPVVASLATKLTEKSDKSTSEKKHDVEIQPGKVKEALASLQTQHTTTKKDTVVIEERKVAALRSAFEAPKGK